MAGWSASSSVLSFTGLQINGSTPKQREERTSIQITNPEVVPILLCANYSTSVQRGFFKVNNSILVILMDKFFTDQ